MEEKRIELLRELDNAKERMFMIDMTDHWLDEDREAYEYWQKEKWKIEKELEKIENE